MSAIYKPITLDELAAFVDIPEEAYTNSKALTEIIRLYSSFLTLRKRIISFIH